MRSETKLPITLVGCGNWGQYILRDLIELNCDVTVVCSSSDSVDRARKYGANRIVDSISEINHPAGIIVATPTSTHLDIMESVLKFDVPIFVEKPLGTDLSQARSLAEKAGEKIFVMDKWRYHHGIEALACIAKSKELGEVIGLNIKQSSWGSSHTDVDFIDTLLPHTLAITYEILDDLPEPRKSYYVERNGRAVALHGVLGKQPWSHFSVSINSPFYCREITLECTSGLAVLNDACSNDIEIYLNTDVKTNRLNLSEKRIVATEMPLLRELRVFINYLTGSARPKSDAYFGVKIMETIMKLRNLGSVKE